MKNLKIFKILFGLSLFTLVACGGNSSDNTGEQSPEDTETSTLEIEDGSESSLTETQQAMKEAKKAMEQLQGDTEVVDFRKLKEILPEKVAGMNRTSHTGEKVGSMGIKMSNAKAEYQDGDKSVDVNIVDVGGFGPALTGLAAWSTLEIDRESDEEIERTFTQDGYKAFEKYNFKTKRGELNLIAEDRFVVSITGRNIERDELNDIWRDLGLEGLNELQ